MSALRHWFVRAPMAQRIDLHGKRMLVTGCAPGSIGFETAHTLAAWGADVVITTRRAPEVPATLLRERLTVEAHRGSIDAHPLDLADAASVANFVDWYVARHGERLDVLVNNAGVHLDLLSRWKAPHLTADGHEIHWRTNYLGTMHLTQRLLPLLQHTGRQTGDARVVNVVSMLHARGINAAMFAPQPQYNSWVAYGTSKLALMHATFELQRRHADTDRVQAHCLHPGAVFTNIADKGLSGHPWLESIRRCFAPVEAFFLLTPREGAQTSVHCATHPATQGGRYYRECQPAPAATQSADAQVAARLWDNTTIWLSAQTG